MDLMRIVNALTQKIDSTYKNDVALICIYGSYIHGATYEKSDIDFYFIPKTDKAYELAKTFIIDDIGFDFWPISWERCESIAAYRQGFVSLIADAQVIWHNNEEDLTRFEALRAAAKNPKIDFNGRIKELFTHCEHLYFELCAAQNFSIQKLIAAQIIANIVELLAVINHTYTHRGWKSSIDEISQLEKIPQNFQDKCKQVLFAKKGVELKESMVNLITDIKAITFGKASYTEDYKNAFSGLYEEEKSIYNKLYHACDVDDSITAIMAGASLQHNISDIMGCENYQKHFCDVVGWFSADDLSAYKILVKTHETQLCTFLAGDKVAVCRYENIDI